MTATASFGSAEALGSFGDALPLSMRAVHYYGAVAVSTLSALSGVYAIVVFSMCCTVSKRRFSADYIRLVGRCDS
jgi:hypothetical protein